VQKPSSEVLKSRFAKVQKDFELTIDIIIAENEGRTEQRIRMLNQSGIISVQEPLRQFTPYLVI